MHMRAWEEDVNWELAGTTERVMLVLVEENASHCTGMPEALARS